jgi:hypothetical protein
MSEAPHAEFGQHVDGGVCQHRESIGRHRGVTTSFYSCSMAFYICRRAAA